MSTFEIPEDAVKKIASSLVPGDVILQVDEDGFITETALDADKVKEEITELRGRVESVERTTLARAQEAERRLVAVRGLHYEEQEPSHEFNQGFERQWCGYCHNVWPCPTVKIIDGETK